MDVSDTGVTADHAAMAAGGPADHQTLVIKVQENLQLFLRGMLPDFLDVVNPRESGLLDVLYSVGVITDRENSSMSGKDVHNRREQARKLFVTLNKLPVEVFLSKVLPELDSRFPHIVPKAMLDLAGLHTHTADRGTASHPPDGNVAFIVGGADIGESDADGGGADVRRFRPTPRGRDCVRHAMIESRIKPTELADLLFHEGLIGFSTYSNVCTVEPHKKDQAWAAVMESLPVLGKSEDSSRALTKLLTSLFVTYFVPVPADLKDTVSAGLPCTCTPARHMLPGTQSVPEAQVRLWLNGISPSKAQRVSTVSFAETHSSVFYPTRLRRHSEDTLTSRQMTRVSAFSFPDSADLGSMAPVGEEGEEGGNKHGRRPKEAVPHLAHAETSQAARPVAPQDVVLEALRSSDKGNLKSGLDPLRMTPAYSTTKDIESQATKGKGGQHRCKPCYRQRATLMMFFIVLLSYGVLVTLVWYFADRNYQINLQIKDALDRQQ